jgi:hypothetical protein
VSDEKIELRLPINTPLEDVMDAWITAVVGKMGTQLKAAYALHIAPGTISRRLNRKRKPLRIAAT